MIRVSAILLLSCVATGLLAQEIPASFPDLASAHASISAAERDTRSSLLGGVQFSQFGIGGAVAFSLSNHRGTMTELMVGFSRASDAIVPSTYLNGALAVQVFHLIPIYLGLRLPLAEGGAAPVSWSWYIRGGAGPTFGLLTPAGLEFADALRASALYWGLGLYAATGLEFVVDGAFALFVQAGVNGFAFARPLDGRSALVGPSVSFGLGRQIP
jgi:hypothetical protein